MSWLLTGGFLKGYRTYVAAAVVVVSAVAAYMVGDADLVGTITTIATGVGLGSLRAAVK